jgi:acyl-CoA synthetase (AMP-forming)/AMP-acid ligase II/acyl carrier protein
MESLDLSHWRLAFCGAEPIRARTLHTFAQRFSSVGFSAASFYPCYGLAEATLLAAGGTGPGVPRVLDVNRAALRDAKIELSAARSKRDATSLVSCGPAPPGVTLKVVDPDSFVECSERTIGEIWLRGESITQGYWNRPEENHSIFESLRSPAKPASRLRWFAAAASVDTQSTDDDAPYFRTGDLGFIDGGELFVTGRIKDVVIVRGRNYFPQDVEATVVQLGHPIHDRAVAFSVEGPRAEGLAVVAEIARDAPAKDYNVIVRDIRRAVIEEHEIDPRVVMLVRPGTISLTTSGKLQRAACRAAVAKNELPSRHRWERSGGTESPPLPIPPLPANPSPEDKPGIAAQVREWLRQWLIARVGIEPEEIEFQRRFDDYGLDSLTAVELSGELEDWSGVELTPATAWQHPTIATMAEFVADGLVGSPTSPRDGDVQSSEAESTDSHAWTAAINQ